MIHSVCFAVVWLAAAALANLHLYDNLLGVAPLRGGGYTRLPAKVALPQSGPLAVSGREQSKLWVQRPEAAAAPRLTIAVVNGVDHDCRPLCSDYAHAHNYGIILRSSADLLARLHGLPQLQVFGKFLLAREAFEVLPETEWVWCVDGRLVENSTVPLEWYIDGNMPQASDGEKSNSPKPEQQREWDALVQRRVPQPDLVFGMVGHDFDGGSFLVRNTVVGRAFLEYTTNELQLLNKDVQYSWNPSSSVLNYVVPKFFSKHSTVLKIRIGVDEG